MLFQMRFKTGFVILIMGLALCLAAAAPARNKIRFSRDWKFNRGNASGAQAADFNDGSWETVCLPHTVREENDYRTSNIYMGNCWYRKTFELPSGSEEKIIYMEFGAAMQQSEVWVNGTSLIKHSGGYDPFVIDITDHVSFDAPNTVAITLNNRNNESFPPGNSNPDFLYFGGLYQDVYLYVLDGLHISHPVLENIPGGGGVFVTYPQVSGSSAKVQVKTHIVNKGTGSKSCIVTTTIIDAGGNEIAANSTSAEEIGAGSSHTFTQSIDVASPKLWSPDSPNLYTLKSEVISGDAPVDDMETTIGIRTINFSKSGGLTINGQRVKLHGCNRHMAYPYIGNAVPASGQYRDALRMKQFGFDFVRMAHYMQPESFIDACDKIGIAGMACLPGWQYYNDSQTFRSNSIKVLRNMIRVYRNHPSVIVYESMHNESNPSGTFLNEAQAAAHEEYPGDQMFTCGEEESNVLDVYVSSSQHGVRSYNGPRACIISEYGDWEHGCVWQANGPITGCQMRMDRSAGESALNTVRSTRADDLRLNEGCSWFTADGIWSVFDYQSWDKMPYTGCGDMDIFRIPKYSSYVTGNQIPLVGELSGSNIKVVIDTAELQFIADGSDIAIVYASNLSSDVTFSVSGPGSLVGSNPAEAIAGIATILLRAETTDGQITVSASSGGADASATVTSHAENPTTGIAFPQKRQLKSPAAAAAAGIRRIGTGISIEIPGAETGRSLLTTFTLYDAQGRVAGRWDLPNENSTVDLRPFAKGVYFGKLNRASGHLIRKVVW